MQCFQSVQSFAPCPEAPFPAVDRFRIDSRVGPLLRFPKQGREGLWRPQTSGWRRLWLVTSCHEKEQGVCRHHQLRQSPNEHDVNAYRWEEPEFQGRWKAEDARSGGLALQRGRHRHAPGPRACRCASSIPRGSPPKTETLGPTERPPVDWSAFKGSLQRGPKERGQNCYSDPETRVFKLRGRTFLRDRKEIKAGEPRLRLAAVDWLRSTARIDKVGSRRDNAVMQAASKVEDLFFVIINMQLPGKTQYSMVFYFACPLADIEPGSVLDGFIRGSDGHRNKRFKFTPRIAEGSWLIRQAVGEHSVTVADALGVTYSSGKNYLEVDVNIGSSPIASSVFGLVMGVITNVVIDFAFVLEAVTEDELPEELLGAVRLSRLQFASAVEIGPSFE